MRRLLLLGMHGQVGWELRRTLAPLGDVVALGRCELDLSALEQIRRTIREVRPHVLVNAAAYTAVDQAESNAQLASVVNGAAPGAMAEEMHRLGGGLVHFSTDYVFDGTKNGPYAENDLPHPLNVYGKSKLEGERAIVTSGCPHLIFRTSWVYGLRGRNFLVTLRRLAQERHELAIVDDQYGAPTWCRLLAEATALVLRTVLPCHGNGLGSFPEVSGLYHLTCAGATTWYGFAGEFLREKVQSSALTLRPIATTEYPTPALRPTNSVLSNDKFYQTFGIRLPAWDAMLWLCLQELSQ